MTKARKRNGSLAVVVLLAIGLAGMVYQQSGIGKPLKDIERRWELSPDQLNRLSIISSSSAADIRFVPSRDGSSYVQLAGKVKPEVFDSLSRTETDSDGLQLDLRDPGSFSFFSLDFRSTRSQITISLPDDAEIGQFQLQTSSGTSNVQGLRAGSADLTTASGNLSVTHAKTAGLNVRTASGTVTAEQIEGPLTVKSSSGNVGLSRINGDGTYSLSSGNLNGDAITGHITLTTASGNITLNSFTGTGEIKASSGNITLTGQRSDHLNISSQSGNVKLSKDDGFKGSYDLHASSGHITEPDSPGLTDDVIEVRTRSGNIAVK